MKIAIVGAGISGIGAALALADSHDVTLIEKDARFGGHANTVEVDYDGAQIAVDTGFIVYNQRNYPNLCGLFEHLNTPTKWSDMSFGFSLDGGTFEYACDDLDKIFAQRRNLLNPGFLRAFRDMMRFIRKAPADMDAGALAGLSLGQWIEQNGFGPYFRERFILPMGGAIWSTPSDRMQDFPAESFVNFFRNHDLLTGLGDAMQWRTVDGGSRQYVQRALALLGPRARAGLEVVQVSRAGGRPELTYADGATEVFDQVLLASHSDQNLAMLADADAVERALLSAIQYAPNRAVLHRDPALMPKRRKVWSSWNFMSQGFEQDAGRPAAVSYWMNRLQGLDPARDLFVSLNPTFEPDPDKVFASFEYAHPQFDQAVFSAQAAFDVIQGRGGVWHAGAWLGYGFHEDGLKAGLRVAAALGAAPAWAADLGEPIGGAFAAAAE